MMAFTAFLGLLCFDFPVGDLQQGFGLLSGSIAISQEDFERA